MDKIDLMMECNTESLNELSNTFNNEERYNKFLDDATIIHSVCPEAFHAVADVLRMGAEKHGDNHAFKKRDPYYYFSKAIEHLNQADGLRILKGIAISEDTRHLSHAGCDILLELEKLLIAREGLE